MSAAAAALAHIDSISKWRRPQTEPGAETDELNAIRTAILIELAQLVLPRPLIVGAQQARQLVLTLPFSVPSFTDASEPNRLAVRALFAHAIRRALAFKALSDVDVRRVAVELLTRSGVLPASDADADVQAPVQPHHVLAASLVVTALSKTRLVRGGSSGLPSSVIRSLSEALRFTPLRLQHLADARKHRPRGFFETKGGQEHELELVAALRAALLDTLQILCEDGVSPATPYALPVIREIGYKRRDLHLNAVAAFVAFSGEPLKAVRNLVVQRHEHEQHAEDEHHDFFAAAAAAAVAAAAAGGGAAATAAAAVDRQQQQRTRNQHLLENCLETALRLIGGGRRHQQPQQQQPSAEAQQSTSNTNSNEQQQHQQQQGDAAAASAATAAVPAEQQEDAGGVLLPHHLISKAAMKEWFIAGKLRSGTTEDDTAMQLALCHFLLRCVPAAGVLLRAPHVAAGQQQQQNQQQQQQQAAAASASSASLFSSMATPTAVLLTLCRCSPDNAVVSAAALALTESVRRAVHDHQRWWTVAAHNTTVAPLHLDHQQHIVDTLDETLRVLCLRAVGTLEHEAAARAAAAFAWTLAQARTTMSCSSDLGAAVAAQQQHHHQHHHHSATSPILHVPFFHERSLGRLLAHASASSVAAYATRVRRVGLVLCVKMFELITALVAPPSNTGSLMATVLEAEQTRLLVGDVAVTHFLTWLSQCGLKLCGGGGGGGARSTASSSAGAQHQQLQKSGTNFEFAFDCVQCALGQLEMSIESEDEVAVDMMGWYRAAFDQMCCELQLRIDQ